MGWCKSLLRPGIVATAVAAAAIAAGCGDDDEPVTSVDTGTSGATGAAGSLDSFIEQADNICAESNAAVANLTAGEATGDTASQELSITEGQVDGLRSLGEPPEDPETWNEFLAAMDEIVAALEKQDLAAQRGEDTSAAATEAATARGDAREAAEGFGLKDCGQEGEAIDSDGDDAGAGPGTAPAAPTPAPAPAPAPAPGPAPAPAPAPAPPAGGTAPPSGGGGSGSGGVSP